VQIPSAPHYAADRRTVPASRQRRADGSEAERTGRFLQPTRGDLVAVHRPYGSASRRHRVA